MSVSGGADLRLTYAVEPAGSLVLPDHRLERRDALWRNTCFELFLKPPHGAKYREFNFAPASAWNAYSFTDWRKGMAPIEPAIAPTVAKARSDFPAHYALEVALTGEMIGEQPAAMSLTAVIEETGGILSYWALAHAPGPADFHQPACFTAMLPPIGEA